MNLVLNIYMSI